MPLDCPWKNEVKGWRHESLHMVFSGSIFWFATPHVKFQPPHTSYKCVV